MKHHIFKVSVLLVIFLFGFSSFTTAQTSPNITNVSQAVGILTSLQNLLNNFEKINSQDINSAQSASLLSSFQNILHNISQFLSSSQSTIHKPISIARAAGEASLWSDSTIPGNTATDDSLAVELGLKFQSSVNGSVVGVRFYKSATNTGAHTANLWTSTGTLLATANFVNETASGWQIVNFSSPVSITAHTTYVVSYYAPVGNYAYEYNYFDSSITVGYLTGLSSDASGGNGVYKYASGGGFPNQTSRNTNYWVDVVFLDSSSSDTTPPSMPEGLSATATSSSQINLSWTASTDNVAVTGYKIFRAGTQIGTSTTASYSDTGLAANTTYSYTVSAYDAAGNNSAQSSSASATTQDSSSDTTPPTVSVTAPSSGSTVSGSVTVSATATDNIGVVGVQFKLDGNNLGTEDTTSPYSTTWDTTTTSNGSHTLTAVARDATGNSTTSSPVAVTVNNTTGGTTYYVAPTGSDSNPGTSASPFLTIQKAANTVQSGGSVIVRAGNYKGAAIPTSGTANARITFSGEPGAIINVPDTSLGITVGFVGVGREYITIEGFTFAPLSGQSQWDAAIRSNGGVVGSLAFRKGNIFRNNIAEARPGANETANGSGSYYHTFYASFQDGIVMENNVVKAGYNSGMYVSNSSKNYIVKGNTVSGVGGNGIHNNGDLGASSNMPGAPGINLNAIIENNTIHNVGFGIGGQAISADALQNSRIQNNLIYDAHAKGISLYAVNGAAGSTGNTVVNNTVITSATTSGPVMRIPGGNDGNILFNNIFLSKMAVPSGDAGLSYSVETDYYYADYNVITDPTQRQISLESAQSQGRELHSIAAGTANLDSIFVNPSANDYHLKAGSLAVNAGTGSFNGKSAPLSDMSGSSRPQSGGYDIGAYESAGGSIPPPSDTTPPSMPEGLSATATSSSQINLSWTASTDNVAVTGYKIFRAGTQIGTSTTASYSDTGLAANTTYSYTVSAYDAAGNNSAQSSSASATTQAANANKFKVGDRVVTTAKINVRNTPNGQKIGSENKGAMGTVIGGPTKSGKYIWWNIRYDNGLVGWSAENWLAKL